MSDVYLFLVRALQINMFTSGGSIIHDNGHNVAWEDQQLLQREYTLQSTDVQELASRRIISINLAYLVCHNWNLNPEGEHFHTKSLPNHEGVLEYLFFQADIYLFIDQHSVGVLNWLFIVLINLHVLRSQFSDN